MESSLKREYRKILRNLEGIRTMDRLPGAVFVVDVKREIIAVKEAQKLGIPVLALIDTDSDPDEVDIAIPGNDDAMRAIELVLKEVGDAVVEGKAGRVAKEEAHAAEGEERGGRRSARGTAPPPSRPKNLPRRRPARRHRPGSPSRRRRLPRPMPERLASKRYPRRGGWRAASSVFGGPGFRVR